MQSIFLWFVENVFVWLLIFYVAVKFVKAVNEQKTGEAVVIFLLGGAAYYFLKNPESTLQFVSDKIISRFFGGGS